MRRRRPSETFNLAFLDIMACGLGAVLLILMVVKTSLTETPSPPDEAMVDADIPALEAEIARISDDIVSIELDISVEQDVKAASEEAIETIASQTSRAREAIRQEEEAVAALSARLAASAPAQVDDPIELRGSGEENYLMGLRVEGRRIAILVDVSSSMTDEALDDIIVRQVDPDPIKQQGPKWQRTLRVVRWLLARLPESSFFTVIKFSETAEYVGAQPRMTSRIPENLTSVVSDLDATVPMGGTNLQSALELAAEQQLDAVYVITDGLPTLGNSNYRSLNPFSDCSSLIGSSSLITPACRQKLFMQTIRDNGNLGGATVNVILLPLEGDPDAPFLYVQWANQYGGTLLSPAPSWP